MTEASMPQDVPESFSLAIVRQVRNRYFANRLLTASDVTEHLQIVARKALTTVQNVNFKDYDPDDDQDDAEFLRVPSAELLDTALLESLRPGPSLKLIDENEPWHNQLHCYAVVLDDGSGTYTFMIRKTNPVKLAGKHLRARLVGRQLDKIDEPILAFDDRFDVIVRGDAVLALDQRGFESLFRRTEVVLQRVDDWVATSFGHLRVNAEDIQAFKDRVASNSFTLRKLQSIAQRRYAEPVTAEGLMHFAREHDMDADALFDGDRLVFTKDTERDILILLNEDIHRGRFSHQVHESTRKKSRSTPSN